MIVTRDEPLARPHSFTVEDYHRMGDAGILRAEDRVELIDGQVVQMSPIGLPHIGCVNRLNHYFSLRVSGRALVSVQNPVRLSRHSEPQPDLMLLRPRADFYGKPPGATAEDVLLSIEVSDSSVRFDREVKAPLYARSGIAEVWLVDLNAGEVHVCRQPGADGYAQVTAHRRGARLSPAALPEVAITVDEVLG